MCTSPVNGEWACIFVLRVTILHPSMILRVDIETFPSIAFLFYIYITFSFFCMVLSAFSGNYSFKAKSTPLLNQLIFSAAKKVCTIPCFYLNRKLFLKTIVNFLWVTNTAI